MAVDDVVKVVSALTGLSGLLIAALSFWLNYRGLLSPLRQEMYKRQCDAILELTRTATDSYQAHAAYFLMYAVEANAAALEEARKEVGGKRLEFTNCRKKYVAILPPSVLLNLDQFDKLSFDHLLRIDLNTDPSTRFQDGTDAERAMDDLLTEAVQVMRKALKTDKLTENVARVIGLDQDERDRRLKSFREMLLKAAANDSVRLALEWVARVGLR